MADLELPTMFGNLMVRFDNPFAPKMATKND